MEVLNNEGLLRLYSSQLTQLNAGVGEVINNERAQAVENFRRLGIPSKKVEKYKYTDLEQVFGQEYHIEFKFSDTTFSAEGLLIPQIHNLETYKIIMVNGLYCGAQKLENKDGVIFGSLASASQQYPEIVAKYYNKNADNKNDGVTALNTAFARDGVFIYFPHSAVLDKPIEIINLSAGESNKFSQNRNLFIFEENARGKVLIRDYSEGVTKSLDNTVGEIYVGKSANAEVVHLQDVDNASARVSSYYTKQEAQSVYSSYTVTLNGGLVRNNISVEFTGEYAENHTYGLYVTDGKQHVDNHSFIDHALPNCTSNELFKGVMNNQSVGVFNGRILVRQDAQKTLAFQSNNNLLLSTDAKVYTKPQLEIYADDVKCSHGATVGQLNEEAVFYMRSRGIGIEEANLLQLSGFIQEVLLNIKTEAMREALMAVVNEKLRTKAK